MKIIHILFLVLCLLGDVLAETYIYFENNTSLNFSVNTVQSGTHTLSIGEWNISTALVGQWEGQKEMMWTNRNTGIHNGDDFYFDVHLIQGSDTITLQLKLTGTFTASNMWVSASGPGFNHPWYGDNNFHQANFQLQGKNYTLKYHSYFTGGYDDIFFALQDTDPYPVDPTDVNDANVFNVLAYNIFMLTPPIGNSDQSTRAAIIPQHVQGYDAIIISEAFYNSARTTLQNGLSVEYPYITAVVDNGIFNDDGGVFIASRFPIDTSTQIVYNDCNGSDCLAAKGVMYAKINKLGKIYHLFGTHTQAWNTASDVATRILQFEQLDNFIQSLNIPSDEAVIIGGDLNVDMIANNLNEYNGMLDSLHLMQPIYTGHPYTYDPDISYYASGTDYEFLDYVMTKNEYLNPVISENKVLILRSIDDSMFNMFDLSDHLAVHGHFEFPIVTSTEALKSIKEEISIFPNPNKGNFDIILPYNMSFNIKLLDVVGRSHLDESIQSTSFYTFEDNLNLKGIYFVLIESLDGVFRDVKRVVIE